ncbi:hypothetical protein ACH5RR_020939 [Cinchona calisaya]|uniref:F-box domain-containing protein n=1 Tax=Cinchona calisaya TaxID=153742 RepID=A0ABD2ZJ70_9GENT
MLKSFHILDGTEVCCSGCKPLPLLILAGTGVVIGIGLAITSSGLWGKTVALVEKYRKHSILEGAFVDKQEDRISLLSDDLLSDIISRLDVIEAVRTRILSRRWKNIFQSRSKLHLDCSTFGSIILSGRRKNIFQYMFKLHSDRRTFESIQHYDKCSRPHKLRFIKAVDQCLQLFSGQSMSYFGLKCCLGEEFASNFNRWMQSIATFGIQELEIKFCVPDGFHLFPFQLLFEAPSLKYLYLVNCTLQPSFIGQFKSLQVLILSKVSLHRGEFTSILSSCVNLERFTVCHSNLPPKLCISGPCLQLRSVRIWSCYGVEEIEIRHGSLSAFHYYTDRMLPYIPVKANTFSSLRILYLLTVPDTKADLLGVRPILAACPLLEFFRLLVSLHFKVGGHFFRTANASCAVQTWSRSTISQSLCWCINKDSNPILIFHLCLQVRGPVGNERRDVKCSPGYHAHLKEMQLQGFRGTRNEIEFASYILRSASALRGLRLFTSYRSFHSDFSWTEEEGYVMDDVERLLIYIKLTGKAISTSARVILCG